MIIDHPENGYFSFMFEGKDWKMRWREFLDRIKQLDDWEYDAKNLIWYLPDRYWDTFIEWKRELMMEIDPKQTTMF